MDDINKLLELAQTTDNFTDCLFDTFLKEHGFTEQDLQYRILIDDLFMFYAYWHFEKYKKIPHRNKFTLGSKMMNLYKIRVNNPSGKGLKWGFKCSQTFRIAFLQFKKDSDQWQKRLKRTLAGRKSTRSAKIRKKEDEQLERLLNMQRSTQDSSQK